jgi:SNF2 family DNA or RNA helicase
MQAKKVTNSVIKLPALHENIHYVDLTDTQQKIYEALLDEDELTSTEKIHLLWKFLHNPKLLELHPDVGSMKLQMLRDNIQDEFDQ